VFKMSRIFREKHAPLFCDKCKGGGEDHESGGESGNRCKVGVQSTEMRESFEFCEAEVLQH
jgi:hypothetical protein